MAQFRWLRMLMGISYLCASAVNIFGQAPGDAKSSDVLLQEIAKSIPSDGEPADFDYSSKLTWENDGALLISSGSFQDGKISRVVIASGKTTYLFDGSLPKLSADGKFLAYATAGAVINIAQIAGDRYKVIRRITTEPSGSPTLSPLPSYSWAPDTDNLVFRKFTQLKEGSPSNPEIWTFDAVSSHLQCIAVQEANKSSRMEDGGVALGPRGVVYLPIERPDSENGSNTDLASIESPLSSPKVLSAHVANYAIYTDPVPSPKGGFVAAYGTSLPPFFTYAALYSVGAWDKESGAWVLFHGPLPNASDPGQVAWGADDSAAYYICKPGAYMNSLCKADPRTGTVQTIALESQAEIESFALDPTGSQVAWVSRDTSDVKHLRVSSLSAINPKTLWHLARFGEDRAIRSTRQIVRWKSFDGLEFEGVLILPVDYRSGHRIPLVVDIHGGAQGGVMMEGSLLVTSPLEADAWAARGYATFLVDYRKGMVAEPNIERLRRHPGMSFHEADADDVIAGINHIIDLGVADPKHIIAIGHSYGAFILNQLITQSDILSAAISKEGAFDLTDWQPSTREENPARYDTAVYAMRTTPDTSKFWIEESSPIFHAYKIKTPLLLIMVGHADKKIIERKCGAASSFAAAINSSGGVARSLFFSDDFHVITKPANVSTLVNEVTVWMDYYLGAPNAPRPSFPSTACP